MIHEIRPGDVVIVTVHESLFDIAKDVIDLQDSILDMTGETGVVTLVPFPNATQTSVHVLRKAGEAKPGWPAWRDVKVEKPPVLDDIGSNMVLFYTECSIRIGYFRPGVVAYDLGGNHVPGVTHWMPLPEGPKV